MEQGNNRERETADVSLSKMASSFYKMQLGVNSVRDELKILNDNVERIANSLDKQK